MGTPPSVWARMVPSHALCGSPRSYSGPARKFRPSTVGLVVVRCKVPAEGCLISTTVSNRMRAPSCTILPHGMQVGGKNHAGGENALLVLALALAEKLLVPFVHHRERRLVAGQQLHRFALAVQDIARRGIAVALILPRCTRPAPRGLWPRPAIRASMSQPATAMGRRPTAVSTE